MDDAAPVHKQVAHLIRAFTEPEGRMGSDGAEWRSNGDGRTDPIGSSYCR